MAGVLEPELARESEAELKSTRTLQIKKWMSKQYARTLIKESLQRARARLGEDYQEQGQEQEQEQDQEHDALAREVSQNYQEMIRSQEESVQKATARFQQDSREMSRNSKETLSLLRMYLLHSSVGNVNLEVTSHRHSFSH